MITWTTPKDVKLRLLKIWKGGDVLRDQFNEKPFTPISIKLKGPTVKELGDNVDAVKSWIINLQSKDQSSLGYGYKIVYKEVNFRNIGKNRIPSYVIIETLNDFLKLTSKTTDNSTFLNSSRQLIASHPLLEEWINVYPHKLIDKVGSDTSKYIAILNWFINNPNPNIYIREFDIEGVDTKFIGDNKKVISEMLDVVLPQQQINDDQTVFEKRYNLKSKPNFVRFRNLDPNVSARFSDISVTLEDFVSWNPNIETVFLIENEINYLTFPNKEKSIVIFGKGFNAAVLKEVTWLQTKEVYYFGDIDTHGFNILSMVRSFLPHTISILMDEETLLSHRAMWVTERKQQMGKIPNLNPEEIQILNGLQTNSYGQNVRLEQERIEFKYIAKIVSDINRSNCHTKGNL